MKNVYIVSACRTAIGKFGGSLSTTDVSKLGATVIKEVINRSTITPSEIDEVIMGNVLQAGCGQGPSRQAALYAGLSNNSVATCINCVCGSGLRSINIANTLISAGESDVIVAGGMENMSASPYILPKMRFGQRLGNSEVIDTILNDALIDAFNGYHMGITAENIAKKYCISREMQDEYAVLSQNRAEFAISNNKFVNEIVPVNVKKDDKISRFFVDEHPRIGVTLSSISNLPAVFKENGTITVANSSGINDGAAAVLLMSEDVIKKYGIKPMARIIGHATVGVKPELMGIGPVMSSKKALKKCGLSIKNMDRIEINEAFAAQVLAVKQELGISLDVLNVNGGAIALGHPIGASGARILVSLLYELIHCHGRFGLASSCIGGGMGVTTIIEML